jgi:ankyrin repeat protein
MSTTNRAPTDEYLHSSQQIASKENIELFEASLHGDFKRVKALLDAGAKPNFFYRPEDQKNALHIAAEHGYTDVVDILIEHGAIVNSVAATDQSTPLILAAVHAHVDVIKKLLDKGAHVNHGKHCLVLI